MKKSVLAALLAAFPVHAFAQVVRAGGEFQVNAYTTTPQGSFPDQPAVTFDAKGNFVVVWDQFTRDGSDYGIFGRRFDAAASPRGAEFQVNTYTTGAEILPLAAALPSGRMLVAWQERQATNNTWARLYSVDGNATAPAQLSPIRTESFTKSGLGMAANGGFVIARLAFPPTQTGDAVLVRRFDASGTPLGDDFRVNTYTTVSLTADVAVGRAGDFVVTWAEERPTPGILQVFGQRYDASGAPLGADFQVNPSSRDQYIPSVAVAAEGGFVIAWNASEPTNLGQVFGRVYLPSGAPAGPAFAVFENTAVDHFLPDLTMNANGDFVVSAQRRVSAGDTDVVARRFAANGTPRGAEFIVNTYTTGSQNEAFVASDAVGNFIVAWRAFSSDKSVLAQRFGGLVPSVLALDESANGILEPGETVDVAPSWRNVNGAAQTFAATVTRFTGPPAAGVTYTLVDGTGDYGTVANGAAGRCTNCYRFGVGFSGTRPATHWDATMTEAITPDGQGQTSLWSVHVANSFTDVPSSSPFYRFVETLLHRGITGGCTAAQYCPTQSTSREQMAVFALLGKEGAGYLPPPCGATPQFADVPPSSPFCRWVEELFRRGVVGGCGGPNYCPGTPVTREQLAVFVLRLLDPNLNPPSCVAPTLYADVPASSPFCRWIEELTRRGIVNGCGGSNYCPTDPVTREQMAVFIGVTFGLTLYAP